MLRNDKTDAVVLHMCLVVPEVGVDNDHVPGVEVSMQGTMTGAGTLRRRLQGPGLDTGDLRLPGVGVQIVVKVKVSAVARGPDEDPHVAAESAAVDAAAENAAVVVEFWYAALALGTVVPVL